MSPERLRSLAGLLRDIGSPAMIIGGLAVSVHGRPRTTLDADVTISLDIGELPRVVAAASRCGFTPRIEDPEPFVRRTRVLPLRRVEDGWDVDLVFAGSPYELEAIGRARSVAIGGSDLPVISPEDLLIHKILAGRPRDVEDAASVVLRQGDRLDRRMVLGVLSELASFLADDDLRRRAEEVLASDADV